MADPEEGPGQADLYATLNVSPDASQDDITKAYRKLVQVFHPDKVHDAQLKDQAARAFGRLQEAYEILSDTHKRQASRSAAKRAVM